MYFLITIPEIWKFWYECNVSFVKIPISSEIFEAKDASLVNPTKTPLSSTSTTIGKNASVFGYVSMYFFTFLTQIFAYSSSNSKIEIHSDVDTLTPWLTWSAKFGSLDHDSNLTFKSPKSNSPKILVSRLSSVWTIINSSNFSFWTFID